MLHPVVVRLHIDTPPPQVNLTHHRRIHPVDDPDNVALGPSIAPITRDTHGDPVSMHRFGRRIGRQEDVAIDALHAATALGLAALDADRRRAALGNALSALFFAAAAAALARR